MTSRHLFFTRVALALYLAVMVALTTLKAFFQIGYLWAPERQRVRELHLIPLDEFAGGSWFAPLFEYAGNFAFFVPFGVLAYMLTGTVRRATAWGFLISLILETVQYAFALGRTDVDDLLFNTLGALAGAAFAAWCGPRLYPVWRWLAIAAGVIFAVLVALGPRLGDPAAVKELSLPVRHVDELGVVQLVGHLDGINRTTTVLG